MTGDRLVPVEQVLSDLLALADPLGPTVVAVDRALGAVLGRPVHAAVAVPAFDNAAMDGVAVRAADTAGASVAHPVRLRVVGGSFAGAGDELPVLASGEAVLIATGGPVPPGADAVVRVERTTPDGDVVLVHQEVRRGTDVRLSGEDLRAGDEVLTAGTLLGPGQLAAAAGCGHAEVAIRRRPDVAVVLTGDEVARAGAGAPLGPHAVHDAVGPALTAFLDDAGAGRTTLHGPLEDDPERLRKELADLAPEVDLLVTVGGISKGARDHLPAVIGALGSVSDGGVALRPGKPFRHGRIGDTIVVCLPGNPGAALVAAEVFLRPVVGLLAGRDVTAGAAWTARLDEPFTQRPGRRHWVRAQVTEDADGRRVRPVGAPGSAMLHALAAANAWMIVGPDVADLPTGTEVAVVPTWGDRGRAAWRAP